MLSFVLCDDNLNILNKLSKMLENLFIKHNIDASVTYTSDKAEDIYTYVQNNHTDVIILDINLKSNVSGIDLAEKIRKNNKDIYIIFSTAHLEYSLIAYSVKTFDYLPKPITMERLEVTLLRLLEDREKSTKNFIHIDNKTVIDENEIDYIKRDGMKLIFYTDKRTYETYSSFNKVKNILPDNFVRCHKSYIANINNIYDIKSNTNTILFNNNNSCYIGPKYKNNIMEVFKHGNSTNNLDGVNNTE